MQELLEIGLSNALAAAVLALLAAAAGVLCRRRPALVHGLWLLVLVKLITPPLLRVPVLWPAAPVADLPAPADALTEVSAPAIPLPDRAVEEPPAGATQSAPEERGEDPPADGAVPAAESETAPAAPAWAWQYLIGGAWLAGSLTWFVLAAWRLVRFRALLRHSQPASGELQETTRDLARKLGLARCPGVWLMPGRLAPMLWAGWGRPRLFVPGGLLAVVDEAGLATLLAHELAHLRRRDHWVRLLELLVRGLYWWHPVVWYAGRELREAEEQCCDAWVVAVLPGAGRTYATSLVDTLDFLSQDRPTLPLLASGLGPVADVKRRLTMILRGTTRRGLGWQGCLALLGLGALLLPLLPAWSQPRTERDANKPSTERPAEPDRSEAPSPRPDRRADTAEEARKAKAKLDQSRADVQVQQAQLEAAMTRLKVAQADVERAEKAARVGLNLAEVQETAAVRIEIVAAPDARAETLREIVARVQKALPNLKVHIRTAAPEGNRPTPVGRPVPENPFTRSPAAPDDRLHKLEKQLDDMRRELDTLRREMKKQSSDAGWRTTPDPTRPEAPLSGALRKGVLYDGNGPLK
jgi:beta-lactamase regulating signal transducer with metallopeptidase domain